MVSAAISFRGMRHTTRAIASIAAVAALATGCATTDEIKDPNETAVAEPPAEANPDEDAEGGAEEGSDGSGPVETVTEDIVAEDPAGDSTDGEQAPGAPEGAPPAEGEECQALPTDPHEQYPSGTAPGRMPAVGDATGEDSYWIEDIENNYDPCAHVSWIVFRGSLGRADAPAGTAASITDGIAFYIDGVPVRGMKTFTAVKGVSKNADDSVNFAWGELGETTAAGITDHYTVTLRIENGTVTAVGGDVDKFNEWWNRPDNEYELGHGELR